MFVTTVPYQTLVPAGTWRVDPAHSSVGFSVKHLGLARVRGWFSAFEGELRVEPGSGDLAAEASVQVASLDTRHEQRDAHLRSPAFFDAARHPRITFQVTGVERLGDSRFRVDGDLTIISGSSGEPVGRRAPPLPTSVLVSPKVTIASLRGEPAAINFWASWCGPCREEAPALVRLARSLDGRAQLVGVNWTDSLSQARSWVDKYRWTFPNLRDANGSVGSDFRLSGLPTTFIIDSRGRIADVLLGPQSESSLREALGSAG